MKAHRSFFFVVLALVLFPNLDAARAATITWTGAGDGVSWNNAANWPNNVPPTAAPGRNYSIAGRAVLPHRPEFMGSGKRSRGAWLAYETVTRDRLP